MDNNLYTKMQKSQYDSGADIMAIQNHKNHDLNPDYYELLLSDIKFHPELWENKVGLDFGCGIGRNVDNLLKLTNWKYFDGCDISNENLIRANKFLETKHNNYNLIQTDGVSLNPIIDNSYDFVMSTIVLQHIAVYEIRFNILKDIYRVLKSDGLFSFQMAKYDSHLINRAKYFENAWVAKGTNGYYDVSVDDPEDLINDLKSIGFKDISIVIKPEWDADNLKYTDINNSSWIFVKCKK